LNEEKIRPHPYYFSQYTTNLTINQVNSATMLASRSMKPKLSLAISTTSTRPSLSLNLPSPVAMVRSPVSPSPISPTARNTRLNQRGYSTLQQPSFAYKNYSSSKSILKKSESGSTSRMAQSQRRRLQFREEPTIHAITPIEAEDCEGGEGYYGSYGGDKAKMSRDERRWGRR
jgi:hypothetical protein